MTSMTCIYYHLKTPLVRVGLLSAKQCVLLTLLNRFTSIEEWDIVVED